MINKAIIMGRLTRDPELRHTGSGTPVCSFTVAVDNGYGENRQADFINCVAWNKTAEFVSKYFTKGRMIIVIGRIATRTWEGQDGKKNYVIRLRLLQLRHFRKTLPRMTLHPCLTQMMISPFNLKKEAK